MRFMDILLSVPSLLLAIVVVCDPGTGPRPCDDRHRSSLFAELSRLNRGSVLTELSSYPASPGGPRIQLRLNAGDGAANCVVAAGLPATLSFGAEIIDAAALG